MRQGGPRERARACRPLAPTTAAEEEEDLAEALRVSARISGAPLTPAAAAAASSIASEGDWELVEPAEEPAPAPVAVLLPVGCTRAPDLAAAAAGLRDLRIYLVWSIGEDRSLAGIHCSAGTAAYDGLLRQVTQWSDLTFCRHHGPREAARAAFLARGRRLGPQEVHFYRWL